MWKIGYIYRERERGIYMCVKKETVSMLEKSRSVRNGKKEAERKVHFLFTTDLFMGERINLFCNFHE